MSHWSEKRIEVRYQETDQMGVVYHANYLVWFELGRTDKMKASGIPYMNMERDLGLFLPVRRAEANYHAPARYGEQILIRTAITYVKGPRIHFFYEIFRCSDRERIVTGVTEHAWVDKQMNPVRLDRRLPELYQKILAEAQTTPMAK